MQHPRPSISHLAARCAVPAVSQAALAFTVLVAIAPLALARSRANGVGTAGGAQTSFDPRTHGFAFTNYFEGDVLVDVPLIGKVDLGDTSYGLCGGMVCAALDTFAAGGAAPPDDDPPESDTKLRSYLYGRQMDTLKAHDAFLLVRLMAWSWRPIESTWLWTGLHELSKGQLLDVLAPELEAGRPVPLCLIRSDIHDYTPTDALSEDGFLENHQVLAIGYRTCAATPGAGAHWGVDVYDPNHPGLVCTLHLLPEGGVQTAKAGSDGALLADRDDPTRNVLGDFRGFFATHYQPRVPYWVSEAPSKSLLTSIAKLELQAITFGEDDSGTSTAGGRTHGPELGTLLAQSSARVASLRAELAALEARIAALDSAGKSASGESIPGKPPQGEPPAGKTSKGPGARKPK